MKKKVSIIIPIYNCEKYISRSINSVLNQTYKNLEIILCNDGSKDNSLKIIKKYEKKYPNLIRVDSHENHGVGYTRNKAIDIAIGDYICFLDADDYLDKDYIEVLMSKIGKNDIIVSGYKQVNQEGELLFNQKISTSFWGRFKQLACTGKIYKRKFLIDNNIKFNDLKIAEDIVFSTTTYSKTSNVKCIEYTGYNYVYNEESVTHTASLKKDNDIIKLLEILKTIINDNMFNNDKKLISYFYIKLFVCFFFDKAEILDYNDLLDYYYDGFNWLKKHYQEKELKLSFVYNKYEPFKINASINLSILVYKIHCSKTFVKTVHKAFYKVDKI